MNSYLFTQMIFVAIGLVIRRHEKGILHLLRGARLAWVTAISFICSYAEWCWIYSCDIEYLPSIFTAIFAVTVFLWALRIKDFMQGTVIEHLGKKYSGDIYITHVMARWILDMIIAVILIPMGAWQAVGVFLIALFLSWAWSATGCSAFVKTIYPNWLRNLLS